MQRLEGRLGDRLVSKDFKKPRGPLALVRYLRGNLSGQADKLAMSDQLYPIMEWRGGLKSVIREADGKYGFTTDEGFTTKLGEGVTFTPVRFEIWDGSSIQDMPKASLAQSGVSDGGAS